MRRGSEEGGCLKYLTTASDYDTFSLSCSSKLTNRPFSFPLEQKLIVDNDRLHKRCEQLTKEVAAFQNMFASMHCLPEHIRREINKQMDAFNQQHQNLVNM